jgi:glucan phosphorylase
MSASLDKIKEEVKALSPDELHQVRKLVDSLLTEPAKPQMTEDDFEQYLAAKGVIALPESAETEDDDWQPVEVTGQPLSELIVEERR